MLVAPVLAARRTKKPDDLNFRDIYDRLYHIRSDVPAVTHVDYSARIQSVNKDNHPLCWQLL